MTQPLEFEKGVAELEARLSDLRRRRAAGDRDAEADIARLEGRLQRLLQQIYRRLGPWQKLQVARHPDRPGAGAYISALVEGYRPLLAEHSEQHGDAVLGGVGRYRGYTVAVLGVETTRSVSDFECATPPHHGDGDKRLRRFLALAESFDLPLLVFAAMTGRDNVADTAAAGSPPRALVTATVTEASLRLSAPMIAVVTGAMLGAGVDGLVAADRVLMLENAVLSPLPPEAAAEALWEDEGQARVAAEALKLTAADLAAFGLVDEVIPEPAGGAHRHPEAAIAAVGDAVGRALRTLMDLPGPRRLVQRHERVLAIGTREPA